MSFMKELDNKTIKNLNEEFDFLNKEIASFMSESYRFSSLNPEDRKQIYTEFILKNSSLNESFFKSLSDKQLHLITLGIASGLKLLPQFLLTYPLLTTEKIEGLIYILEQKNILNLVVEQLIFMDNDEFIDIINALKQGKGCADIINNLRDKDAFVNVFNLTNELDDEFFSNLLNHMDLNYWAEEQVQKTKEVIKKGTVIQFDKDAIRRRKNNQE